MKKSILTVTLLSFFALQGWSQQISNTDDDTIVAKVGDKSVTLSDVVEMYSYNSPEEDITREAIQLFLPSYVEYKMKLLEGYEQELDKEPEIIEELENYGRQSAFTFWMENEVKQQMIDEHLEKSRYEIKAFHVLGALDQNASPDDTTAVYENMLDAREEILAGGDLDEINSQYSSTREGRSMGGTLPWLRAGTTVPEFEQAIFELSEGEVSMPVRTQFGYHVIKLIEKRDRTPDRMVSHIFVQSRQDGSDSDAIEEVYDELNSGMEWDQAVAEFSDDNASIANAGSINWVGYGSQFEEGFIDSVMQVDPELSYSKPIESVYGYHILRIDSVRTYRDDDHLKEEIVGQLQQQQRLNLDRQQVIESLKKEGNYTVYADNIDKLDQYVEDLPDDNFGELNYSPNKPERSLFTFLDKTYSYSDFIEWLKNNRDNQSKEQYSDVWLEEFTEEVIESKAIDITVSKFPEFEKEMNRFLDGLIVFQISNEHVWDPETADLGSIQEFYNEHKENYRFDQRFAYYLVSARSDSLLEKAQQQIDEGMKPSELIDTFEDLRVHNDSTRNNTSSSYEALKDMEENSYSEIFSRGVYQSFYYLDEILEPRLMTFDEAYRRVVSDYQPIREDKFMNYLEDKYSPTLFPERIE